jgi:hypothetical protein
LVCKKDDEFISLIQMAEERGKGEERRQEGDGKTASEIFLPLCDLNYGEETERRMQLWGFAHMRFMGTRNS